MPDVRMPDGAVVRFPDDMPPDQIKSIIATKFPETGQGASDTGFEAAIRGAADAMSFGLADEFAAGMGALTGIGGEFGEYQKNLQAQRARDEADAAQRPMARLGGQIGGGAALGVGLGNAGATLMRQGAPLMQNIGAGAVEGALYGGAYGMGSGEGFEDRVNEAAGGAAGGAVVGAASPVVAKGLEGLVNAVRQSRMDTALVRGAPTTDDLFDAGRKAYDAADNAGVAFDPTGIGDLGAQGADALRQFGAHPQLQPRAYAVLNAIQDAASSGQPLKLRDVENLRKIASNAIRGTDDASDKAATSKLLELIDAFETDPASPYVVMGDQAAGSGAIKEARDLWRRASKSDQLVEALTKAERQAASAGSGANIDNAIRQQVKSILNSPKKSTGFTADETKALEQVVRGTPGQNLLRLGGKMAPTGIVSGMGTIGLPTVAGSPELGFMLAVSGMGMKAAADRATGNNLALADAIIRAGKRPTTNPATRSAMESALRQMGVGGGAIGASASNIPEITIYPRPGYAP